MNEKFIKIIYTSIVEGNMAIYKGLFDRENGENTIEYWKNARKLYRTFDEPKQEIFFSIIKQVIIDTTANLFGVIDGVSGLDGHDDWVFQLEINGQGTNDELSDTFLEYVETLEGEA